MKSSQKKLNTKVSDEAVLKATGKHWLTWFNLIDKAKLYTKTHKEIANWLNKRYVKNLWWTQMITVEYEYHKGIRNRHQKTDSFEISVSKTFEIPASNIYKYFIEPKLRNFWLYDYKLTITTKNENKSLRAIWSDGKTRINAHLYKKGKNKTQLVIEHIKLPDAKTAEKAKEFWKKSLDKLKTNIR